LDEAQIFWHIIKSQLLDSGIFGCISERLNSKITPNNVAVTLYKS